MSLASVLVISAKRRTLSLKTLASASAAALRFFSSGLDKRLSVSSSGIGSASPSTLKRSAVIVSLNRRSQAEFEVWLFSWNSRSSVSSSW